MKIDLIQPNNYVEFQMFFNETTCAIYNQIRRVSVDVLRHIKSLDVAYRLEAIVGQAE